MVSFKVFRFVRPVLASALVASSFVSPRVSAERSDSEYYMAEIVLGYCESKFCGPSGFDAKLKEDFEFLNDSGVFNGALVMDYAYMDKFRQYVVLHRIRAFFEAHEELRKVVSFCHRKLDGKALFALYDFKSNDAYRDRMVKVLEKNGKKIGDYATMEESNRTFSFRKDFGNAVGNANPVGKMLSLGLLADDDWCRVFRENIEGTRLAGGATVNVGGERLSTMYEIIWKGLGNEVRNHLKELCDKYKLEEDEIRGLFGFVYNILHELSHSVAYYVRCLELMREGKPMTISTIWNGRLLDVDFIPKCYLGMFDEDQTANYARMYCMTGVGACLKYRKVGGYLGHTDYGFSKDVGTEDFAETFAFESMPSAFGFEMRSAAVKAYKAYAQRLLSILEGQEERRATFRKEALRYLGDFVNSFEEKRKKEEEADKRLGDLVDFFKAKMK